jgi:ribonucleoside-diphosphate reductase alpha chain
MQMGLAYDSDEGRRLAAALSALLSASAWETSAELACVLSPFEAYTRNREPLLQVLRNHISLLPESRTAPSGLNNIPLKVSGVDRYGLFAEAERRYASALLLGDRTGFRNAQLTVVAPTGTIGFVMDCDTTGIEPDFALVKYKKLSGGGFLRIVNQSVRPALFRLGYTNLQVDAIILYLSGCGSIADIPHLNRKNLAGLGFTQDVLMRMEQLAPTVMHIRELFQLSVLGSDLLMKLGVPDSAHSDLSFDLPVYLGFTPNQINEADKALVGHLTMEGAPFLKPEHYSVFDCAVMGSSGRTLSVDGHLKMMSVVQAFICGAISKTVNLTQEADAERIKEVYLKAWKLGIKAVSIYRDGSKGAQPLVISQTNKSESGIATGRLSSEDRSWNLKLDGKDVVISYRTHGTDGRPELYIDLPEAEMSFRMLLQCFARAVSLGLKSGVPLDEFVSNFIRTRFEPAGLTSDPHIRLTSSVLDLCFRILGYHYLNRTELANVSDGGETSSVVNAEVGGRQKNEVIPWLYNFALSTPPCPFCGYPTIPSGNCYKCSNCGTSLGCT